MNHVTIEASYNFDRRGLRGADFNVLPFLRVFPPYGLGGYPGAYRWTIHFGWLWWTVIIHRHG